MTNAGLTIIELLVALAVLTIGAVALAGLQLASLRLAQVTEVRSRLLHVAEAELAFRRLGLGGAAGDCRALPEGEMAGLSCRVSAHSCELHSASVSCGPDFSGPLTQFTVQASHPTGGSISLTALSRSQP